MVQSMTDTDTADVAATVDQVRALAEAGSELVRVTVNNPDAAEAVPEIRRALDRSGCRVPLVGDFHYNGDRLLTRYPECARALAKYRINPGNVGFGEKRDERFATMVEAAIEYGRPVRIGVNWGSLDQSLATPHEREREGRRAEERGRGDPRGARAVRPAKRKPSRGARARARPHRHLLQGERGPGARRGLPRAGCPRRLRPPPRPHRGRHGLEGDRGLRRRPRGAPPGGDRRHHPDLPYPGARGRAHARGGGRPGAAPDDGTSFLRPAGHRLSGLRADDERVLPRACGDHPGAPAREHGRVARALRGGGGHAGRGHGLRGERPGREQAREHRHQPAGDRGAAGRARLHRRGAGDDPARPRPSPTSSAGSSTTTSNRATRAATRAEPGRRARGAGDYGPRTRAGVSGVGGRAARVSSRSAPPATPRSPGTPSPRRPPDVRGAPAGSRP